MTSKLTSVCVIVAISICAQARAQNSATNRRAEEARVRAIVEKLAGPSIPAESPKPSAVERAVVIERFDLAAIEPQREEPDEFEDTAPVVVEQVVAVHPNLFDRVVFGNRMTERARIGWLETALKARLIDCGVQHALTTEELAKLHLAGKGDIKRFFTQFAEKRRDFEAAHRDKRNTQKALLNAANPLGNSFRLGPFQGNSLFAKTLNKILNDR